MARCIYRTINLNDNKPEDDDTATIEHIVPWAIGGSNNFSTRDASKKSNNDLGSEVDKPFMNCLPLAIKRHQLQIKAQSGSIEPIVWDANTDVGAKGRVTFHSDGKVEFDLPPKVLRDAGGNIVSVGGSKDRVIPIFEGLLKGWRKRGESASDKDGNALASISDILTSAEVQLVDTFKCRVEYFDLAGC